MQFFNKMHLVVKSLLMRKLIAALLFTIFVSVSVVAQQWDRHMQVRKMDIQVKAGPFTATTFIEMEFYNPTDTEMEGLYTFYLEPNQAITAFQLDLFGKFRDGSIEERWKASNAYNTIVGKRVDPALLQMDHLGRYSLRIYPVPAKSSRSITMTIEQLLTYKNDSLFYRLPLAIKDTIERFKTTINVARYGNMPVTGNGLLKNYSFTDTGNSYSLSAEKIDTKADQPINFSTVLPASEPVVCTKRVNEKTYFAVRFKPGLQKEYNIHPGKITVFWDVSASGATRDIAKEISFLENYITFHKISRLTIITFNHKLKDTLVFNPGNPDENSWSGYLRSVEYEGGKQLGCLNFSNIPADAILVFSNGFNSFGSSVPVPGYTHVYCLNSSSYHDSKRLSEVVGQSGGRVIDLYRVSIEEAIQKASYARNILFAVTASYGKVHIDQRLGELEGNVLTVTGYIDSYSDDVSFHFGNRNRKMLSKKVSLDEGRSGGCEMTNIGRIAMLEAFPAVNRKYNWYELLEFGKKEKVVTLNTSYIVLEKLEDYIKFNITPPKELESQCDMNLFVDAAEKRKKAYKIQTEFDILSAVVSTYNERIKWWGNAEPPLVFTKEKFEEREIAKANSLNKEANVNQGGNTNAGTTDFPAGAKVVMGTEVVVTALGQTRQSKELTYSVAKVRYAELTQAKPVNLQNGLTGKVSGLQVQSVNTSVFADTRITLRGIRSLTGDNQPMLVLDGLPLPLGHINRINPNDVVDVTILKSASSTAIYGPDGANGAIIVNTKRGNRWRNPLLEYRGLYKLKECEDVEYLERIKEATFKDKIPVYKKLKEENRSSTLFYIDMAEYLLRSGYEKEALSIIYSAADVSHGDSRVLKSMGYVLEAAKKFEEALKVYQYVLAADSNDIHAYRDLALVYYQQKDYQRSIEIYYQGLTRNFEEREAGGRIMKAAMLQEMSAIISIHKSSVNLSEINMQIVKPLPVDLRITLDCNVGDLYGNMSVMEPGGAVCSYYDCVTKNGGRISTDDILRNINISSEEYQVKKAKEGKYRIRLNYVDSWYGSSSYPAMIKIVVFKNLGKANQSVTVENAIMNNQFGLVEIGEVKW